MRQFQMDKIFIISRFNKILNTVLVILQRAAILVSLCLQISIN